jgi:hypothetical protein
LGDGDSELSSAAGRVQKTRIASKSPMTKNLGKIDKMQRIEKTTIDRKEETEEEKNQKL